ncbi:MAG: cytochrome c nitrite reductase small subunit [Myxococcales bacterium]
MASLSSLRLAAAALAGAFAGVAGYTFVFARGASYLGNDPNTCTNCHVMSEQFAGWTHGSHRSAATCNDCHAPHALIPKLLVKAENGFRHSWAFSTGRFPDAFHISDRDRAVTEGACRSCHGEIVSSIDHGRGETSCTRCHGAVGHPF